MEEVHIDLYREHLEEASFLYDQRLHLLTDPELPWTALHDFEQRLEAHIDALVVGGELALRICRERADEGDAGELFAAVCVYCRQAQPRLLSEVLQHPEAHAPERARALAEALKHELPEAWQAQAVRALEQGRAELVPVWRSPAAAGAEPLCRARSGAGQRHSPVGRRRRLGRRRCTAGLARAARPRHARRLPAPQRLARRPGALGGHGQRPCRHRAAAAALERARAGPRRAAGAGPAG
jgi:hypothetical protein